MKQGADAAAERARHGDLARAQQGHGLPAGQRADGERRELRVQIVGHGEDRAGDVFGKDSVLFDEDPQQLQRAREDLRRVVARRRSSRPALPAWPCAGIISDER